ncbi:hypothetical protein BKA70DRAFT_1188541 [Coprinopsis sp. MPI-PUGE-AT-0042]|nr:hypothetical protein BKA70DRAFT_1188541 [Coprinopsis sp. MPI-PUGE-AT-0042]
MISDEADTTAAASATAVDYSLVYAVPGHGKPLNYAPAQSDPLFVGPSLPSALRLEDLQEGGAVLPLLTLREISMLRFMNAITDKEGWHIKVFDDEIATKWKNEAIAAARAELRDQRENPRRRGHQLDSEEGDSEDDSSEEEEDPARFAQWPIHFVPRDDSMMTPAMSDYCIAELRHRAKEFQHSPTGAIVVYNGDVVKSDVSVSLETKQALQRAVEPLENVPDIYKDWHPGSNERVLDLVHPSLFPLLYGKSRVLAIGDKVTTLADFASRSGAGSVIPLPEEPGTTTGRKNSYFPHKNPYSTKFQWLPCEVDITGTKPRIISYINNLHPDEHTALYDAIEDVIAAAIPLWDMTLAPVIDKDFYYSLRIYYPEDECPVYDPDPENIGEEDGPPEDGSDLRWEWEEHIRRTILPEPDPFDANAVEDAPEAFSLKEKYGKLGRPLQIIVKLANIELTPDKPEYEGGTWHVEGKLNENIVATALYYYSSENITPSSLAFRQIGNSRMDEVNYDQGVHNFLKDVYGCENLCGAVQEVGSVETREGRLLTFTNILQHRVKPFELVDKTKPGHRKILALFLVDPNVRVLSTAHVPPQQSDWWRKSIREDTKNPINSLPVELQEHVYGDVDDFPIGLDEAKRLREEFMEERKVFVIENSRRFRNSMNFSLCEH